jgi:hypothetical protein
VINDASSHQTSISNRPNVAARDVPMATTIARLMVEDLTRQVKERNEKPTRKKPALCLRIIQAWLRFG